VLASFDVALWMMLPHHDPWSKTRARTTMVRHSH
jgi:hypothetical protein